MILDADRVGGALTVGADARITRPGARLRRWKLDELPQLLNVVTSEMGFMGPRSTSVDEQAPEGWYRG